MKKCEDRLEQAVVIAVAAFIALTAAVLTFAWIANRPPETPGTGIPGESLELRDETIRFVQENEVLLQQAVQELKTLPEGTYEIFYHRLVKEYIANNGTHRTLENQFLIDLLENTTVDSIDGLNGDWIFLMEYGEDSLFEIKTYSFVFSNGDPAAKLDSHGTWHELGNGRTVHWDITNGNPARYLIGNSGDIYLEELDNGFWYFYEYSG